MKKINPNAKSEFEVRGWQRDIRVRKREEKRRKKK